MKRVLSPLFLLIFFFSLNAQNESTLSETERVYGLSQLWKATSMNFAFFEQVPDLDWDSLYLAYIPKVMAAKSDYEYARLLQSMCAQLKDGHTRAYLPRNVNQHRGDVAVFTKLIDGKVYITDILNDKLATMGIQKGMEILKINDIDVHDYAENEIKPYCFASTPQDLNIKIYHSQLLTGWAKETAKLTLKDLDDNIKTIEVPRNLDFINVPTYEMMSFQKLANNTGHLTIRQFWGEEFFEVFDSLYQMVETTEKLIVDIRVNQGGNSGFATYVLRHLSDKPFYTSNWSTPVYNAAFASWNREQEWYSEKGNLEEPVDSIKPYGKPVVVLIGPQTYSAAEDFCSYYQQADIGPMIGSPTAGSTGNPIGVNLVKNFWAQICTKKDVFYDGTEFVGYGVKPDIKAEQSAEDFWKEEDTVLNYAVSFLNK